MLYFLPTPIGNLDDISKRCLDILNLCDIIICEDSRVTKSFINLLNSKYNLEINPSEFYSLHTHNESEFFAKFDPNNLIEKSINENCENGVLLKKQYTKEVDDEKIIYHTVYNVEENIGKFVEADENVDYLLKREENNSN